VAVIVNVVDFLEPNQRRQNLAQELERLQALNLDYTEVDLRSYFGKYDATWMRGGNCFVLRQALRRSGADEIISELLANDSLVYAGYGAGIDMLVPSLHGAKLVDDPNLTPEGYDGEVITKYSTTCTVGSPKACSAGLATDRNLI
jgi:dipeptidase E